MKIAIVFFLSCLYVYTYGLFEFGMINAIAYNSSKYSSSNIDKGIGMNKKTKEAESENTTSYTDYGFNTKLAENKVLYALWQKVEHEMCMKERKYGIDFELALT